MSADARALVAAQEAVAAQRSAVGTVRKHLTVMNWAQEECAVANGTKRAGWHHPTLEALVLAKGVAGNGLAKLPRDMRKGRLGQCFKNAAKQATARPAYTYVEGWACKPGLIPLHHAWLLAPSGAVVDPTWGWVPGTDYLGLPFELSYVLAATARTGVWGLFYQDWELMSRPPDTWLRLPA